MTKHIFVTGGVVSGIGKGITVASLGRLLKARGLKVASQKFDPYMNVDCGMMSPYQHGEVFVTDDGAETDLDIGHYERFMDVSLSKFSNLTAGKIYFSVLNRERAGGYSGQTVQVIPHITDEIKRFIYEGAKSNNADILITEIGGTAGDIESQPFFEAIRQISLDKGRKNCLFIHVTLIPYLKSSGEYKSKPTQHSVKQLQAMGISPDIIITRSDESLNAEMLAKLSLFCNVDKDCVIENITLPFLYEIPLMFSKNGLDKIVCRKLSLKTSPPNLSAWEDMVEKIKSRNKIVKIAIIGEFTKLHDAYLSVIEALNHAGYEHGTFIDINWIDGETLNEKNFENVLSSMAGILIPGGFGEKGSEGNILACKYARENNIPFLGICLGMQTAVIEFARNVCGLDNANSVEFDKKTKYPVIDITDNHKYVKEKGGTMRLGAYPCIITPGTLLEKLYKQINISERHRHKYEVNNAYKEKLTNNGMKISGISPDGYLVEAVELPENDFFVGVQFHPEYKSRPNRPHPLFVSFISAAMEKGVLML